MLYMVGLGLGGCEDISVRGLKAVQSCSYVFLEAYTSVFLDVSVQELSEYYGRTVEVADRDLVESESDSILEPAKTTNVAFLVVGDVFGATTHSDLFLRAKKEGIEVKVIHNAGIMNAVSACGLQLYTFGQAITLCFWTDTCQPDSWYERILSNRGANLHTLVLLDIKVKEQSVENLLRGRKIYEPPRYMTIVNAAEQLIQVENRKGGKAYSPDTWVIGLARIGTDSQKMLYAPLRVFTTDSGEANMGSPLHCLVIPAPNLHCVESDHLKLYSLSEEHPI